jgi:predicted metal-dependent hydrolase
MTDRRLAVGYAEPMRATEIDPIQAGILAFDRGAFFDAHEHWEDAWRVAREPERTWLQGAIQLAAALHKTRGGKLASARRLVGRAASKLVDAPSIFGPLDLAEARRIALALAEALDEGRAVDVDALRLGPGRAS